ncbi:hypothetical protein AMEX_G12994 [Astyanax mexicanus]|uniref:Secreted protein n=1 Tax=Astyanax mexicanus TaxID=7994 RepID=A0A8T2LIZ5_ASTMX|nr:hypothetical protein AMEX_G12994 [Astyanax mexicanus]
MEMLLLLLLMLLLLHAVLQGDSQPQPALRIRLYRSSRRFLLPTAPHNKDGIKGSSTFCSLKNLSAEGSTETEH